MRRYSTSLYNVMGVPICDGDRRYTFYVYLLSLRIIKTDRPVKVHGHGSTFRCHLRTSYTTLWWLLLLHDDAHDAEYEPEDETDGRYTQGYSQGASARRRDRRSIYSRLFARRQRPEDETDEKNVEDGRNCLDQRVHDNLCHIYLTHQNWQHIRRKTVNRRKNYQIPAVD